MKEWLNSIGLVIELHKWMLRRYWKLNKLNQYWYDVLDEYETLSDEWTTAYRYHRQALDKMLAWRRFMDRFGWIDLTWNYYYGSPNRYNNPVFIKTSLKNSEE